MLKTIVKLKLKAIGIIIVGVVVIQIISAYFFGIMAEKQINSQFKQITDSSLIKVTSRNYQRGWFTSTESVNLSLNNQLLQNLMTVLPAEKKKSMANLANTTYTINYTTTVTHGLFAGWLHGDIMPSLAYASTKISFPDKLDKLFKKFFNGKDALTIDNIIYPNKAGKYLITSPKFNYDEAVSGVLVKWGGLKLKIAYNDKFDQFTNSLIMPMFDMSAPNKGELNFNGFTYNSTTKRSLNQIKVGTTALELNSLAVHLSESDLVQFKLGQAITFLTGVNSAEFLNGLDIINPSNFTISGIKYASISDDSNKIFNAQVHAQFESLVSNKRNYGPMNFDFSLDHVLAAEFNRLIDNLNLLADEDQSKPATREKTIALLKQSLTPIFAAQPIIKLSQLKLGTPNGNIVVSANATTHDFESADMYDQNKFMHKLIINLDFTIPKPALAYLFLLQMKYFLTAGNAQMDQQSSEALAKVVNILLDNQLHVWLKKGYLHESANLLSSSIKMESGVTSLNGVITK